jgi:hypothetical protein
VLAFPGARCAASDEIGAAIAASVRGSCPGVAVHVGYLEGGASRLGDVLAEAGRGGDAAMPSAVVVPMLAGPVPVAETAMAEAVAHIGAGVIVTSCLGPHPLLAEALHGRLADAGLARAGRIRQISIVTAAEGVMLAVAGEMAAVQEAGIVAVLLAARLAIPVVPASLRDPASLAEALARLADARVTRLALAPCVIGPETSPGELATVAAAIGARHAPPIGAHPAVGQLAAIRYGAALQDPRIALS